MNQKKIVRICAYAAAFFLCLYGALFLFLKHSEPYRFAASSMEGNAFVVAHLGRVKHVGLAPFVYSSAAWNATSGSALLTLSVSGEQADGTVTVEMEKKSGAWNIKTEALKVRDEAALSGPQPPAPPSAEKP